MEWEDRIRAVRGVRELMDLGIDLEHDVHRLGEGRG